MIQKRRSKIHCWGVFATEGLDHSCRPNCYSDIRDGIIWIRVSRTIRKSEELTYHYHTDREGRVKCQC